MKSTVIVIASEFSKTPAGRFETDGPYSGQLFREKVLFPSLQENDSIEVDLDGTLGYGSSFLEEAFGGLVREKNMTASELKRRIKIKSKRQFYADRIWHYIEDASAKKKA